MEHAFGPSGAGRAGIGHSVAGRGFRLVDDLF